MKTKASKGKASLGSILPEKEMSSTRDLTAKHFVGQLKTHKSATEREKIQRYFKSGKGAYGEGDVFMGVRMGTLFKLSEEFIDMVPEEIEKLLESTIHEIRAGAVSIMNKQCRSKKATEERRKALFELYLDRHDRINNWDLVDLGAAHVVGRYLFDKPRKILYQLARSKDVWERRTAMVSTSYFLTKGQVEDTFNIAELLINDEHDLIHKAAGGWIRQAGKIDRKRLLDFLDKYAATMPRTFLRYAIEHLDQKQKAFYMSLKKAAPPRRAASAGQ
jgi:3-methyladenine DNA glycosylase AlkD